MSSGVRIGTPDEQLSRQFGKTLTSSIRSRETQAPAP